MPLLSFFRLVLYLWSGALYCAPIFRVIKATMTTLNNLAIDIFCSVSDKEEIFVTLFPVLQHKRHLVL